MPLATEHIRRMRGGAQSHLMRCEDENFYIVKFQNNPQGTRILANELLGTRLAARMGVAVAGAEVIEVRPEMVALTEDLVVQLGRGRVPCAAGLEFGSQYPGHPATTAVYDFLPDEQLRRVENLADFCGIFVFDKWTCNTNGRQAIFLRARDAERYRAVMIDHGFCFNASEWNFPDAPLRGIYARSLVYEQARGWEAFEPWIERVEKRMNESVLDEVAREIPPEWSNFDQDALYRLLERLLRRRKLVRELVLNAKNSSRMPFPHWT
ncbi:MAG: HipA family kinase [Candidatus Acidiferrales bacterium]